MSEQGPSTMAQLVGIYLVLSGSYHLLDAVSMVQAGLGDAALNVLFAGLGGVLGVALVVSGVALFRAGAGDWALGVALVILLTVVVDVVGIVLRTSLADGLDAVLLLACLGLLVSAQSGDDARADMDEEESVHSLSDYP